MMPDDVEDDIVDLLDEGRATPACDEEAGDDRQIAVAEDALRGAVAVRGAADQAPTDVLGGLPQAGREPLAAGFGDGFSGLVIGLVRHGACFGDGHWNFQSGPGFTSSICQ